ncbi:MAG: U32 family peptidase [Victivallales bacterium]
MMELLAPAGNLECALAAFDAGADAVYCGLKRFNARERTENFTFEEMSRLLAYAHKLNRHVYVTFNTLIKEDELDEAAQELARLEQLRPDAIIIQDLGIARIARKYFPKLVLHGSTQMGLHNSAGLAYAKTLGLSRVILERQTTLAELEQIMRSKPPVEVEIFIHGALCCCISGTCLLSSWLGGWSGNRGKCKQPCRRRHRSADGNGFFLSAQDLGTPELIPRLMKSGAASFKIEGRLRRADYVTNVVTAYRMLMDAASKSDEEFRMKLPEAKNCLARTYGRKWSPGYYTKESAASLIKHDAMGVSGLLCAKVVSTSQNGFTMSMGRNVFTGDMIRIQPPSGDEGPAIRITKMTLRGKNISCARKGEEIFVHADKEIPRGGLVYKIGERTEDYSARIAALPARLPLLDIDVKLSRTFCRVEIQGQVHEQKLELSEAEKQPLDPKRVIEEFSKLHDSRFETGSVHVSISGNPFLPSSVLRQLRKECGESLLPRLDPHQPAEHSEAGLEHFRRDHAELAHQRPQEKWQDTALIPRGRHPKLASRCIIAREMDDTPAPNEELLLPFYINESSLKTVREAIAQYVKKGGKTVRITSLSHFELLKDYPGLTIKTCMPLPVCNSMAVKELEQRGAALAQGSLELGKTELAALAKKSVLPFELYRYGRPVLLSTRALLPVHGRMQDSKGDEFLVEKHGILTQVLPDKVLSLPPLQEADAFFYDLRSAAENEQNTAHFNFDITLA